MLMLVLKRAVSFLKHGLTVIYHATKHRESDAYVIKATNAVPY